MKLLSMFAALVLSASSFGAFFVPSGTFIGRGIWKMPNGDTGKYESRTVAVQKKTEVEIKETLVIHAKDGKSTKESFEWTAVWKGQGFFTASVRGTDAGTGYCLNDQCHVEFTKNGSKAEETFTFRHGQISRLGSETSTQYTVTWQGAMHKTRH